MLRVRALSQRRGLNLFVANGLHQAAALSLPPHRHIDCVMCSSSRPQSVRWSINSPLRAAGLSGGAARQLHHGVCADGAARKGAGDGPLPPRQPVPQPPRAPPRQGPPHATARVVVATANTGSDARNTLASIAQRIDSTEAAQPRPHQTKLFQAISPSRRCASLSTHRSYRENRVERILREYGH